ncbi:MAG: hypothetical protein NT041_02620 [Candidatus Vogelbacteria bacterium]|nr:hypothetical protein [Candidatus Vogelbacteria bacterium]
MKKKKKSGSPAKYFIGLIALFLVMAGGLTLVKAGGGSASLANADSSKSLAAVAALTPVPTSPTVTLKSGLVSQIYSKPDGGQLKMSFSLVITNNTGSTIYIPKSYSPFWPSFINTTRGNVIGDPACMPSSGPTSLVPLVWDYSKTNSYLQLNAGQTINYLVTKACNINQMFAGKYTARLGDITWTTSMAPTMIMQSASTNIVSSNSQLIVGETGPWISGVQVSEKNSDVVYIFGERLLGTEKKSKQILYRQQRNNCIIK